MLVVEVEKGKGMGEGKGGGGGDVDAEGNIQISVSKELNNVSWPFLRVAALVTDPDVDRREAHLQPFFPILPRCMACHPYRQLST